MDIFKQNKTDSNISNETIARKYEKHFGEKWKIDMKMTRNAEPCTLKQIVHGFNGPFFTPQTRHVVSPSPITLDFKLFTFSTRYLWKQTKEIWFFPFNLFWLSNNSKYSDETKLKRTRWLLNSGEENYFQEWFWINGFNGQVKIEAH